MIREYASSLIQSIMLQAESLKDLDHKPLKGALRELFLSALLKHFLASQYGVCSGIVTNSAGGQSRQLDVVVFDNRVVPPLVHAGPIAVIPAESLLAAIEVKSVLQKRDIEAADRSGRQLIAEVCRDVSPPPIVALFGYFGRGPRELRDREQGRLWLDEHAQHLTGVCLAGVYSWLNMESDGWAMKIGDETTYADAKRFLAVLLDNCRTLSNYRWNSWLESHRDWIGAYIREPEV